MLTFFKRIRKGLLGEGAVSKYLLYAFGEILLVMIGILLALQVNNWNETRSKRSEIGIYLGNLQQSLNDDISHFTETQYQNSSRFNCFKFILNAADISYREDIFLLREESDTATYWNGIDPKNHDRSFIDLCFEFSTKGRVLVVNKSTLDELKGTGLFSFIENESLKKMINDYYDSFDFHFSSWREKMFKENTEDWKAFMRENYSIDHQEMFEVQDPIGLVKNNNDIQLEIKRLMRDAIFRANGATQLKLLAEELIRSVEEELEKM